MSPFASMPVTPWKKPVGDLPHPQGPHKLGHFAAGVSGHMRENHTKAHRPRDLPIFMGLLIGSESPHEDIPITFCPPVLRLNTSTIKPSTVMVNCQGCVSPLITCGRMPGPTPGDRPGSKQLFGGHTLKCCTCSLTRTSIGYRSEVIVAWAAIPTS